MTWVYLGLLLLLLLLQVVVIWRVWEQPEPAVVASDAPPLPVPTTEEPMHLRLVDRQGREQYEIVIHQANAPKTYEHGGTVWVRNRKEGPRAYMYHPKRWTD